jgi:hypothetical protein
MIVPVNGQDGKHLGDSGHCGHHWPFLCMCFGGRERVNEQR